MATRRMLVDATHPEETRVVVTNGNRIEEFDFESATRRQLRGNIYLAKVTRVEPSLQAAFIEYGGNRHGFLAFAEIHPDYYQIPVADREALLREEEAEDEKHAAAEIAEVPSVSEGVEAQSDDAAPAEATAEADPQSTEADAEDDDSGHIEQAPSSNEPIESLGGDDALEEMPERRTRAPSRRQYKIQEVIKRRQVMLVQVVKEERGNKGAALTTYLSLAGRYSVLMPNTARGGGISRKITNTADRKRLKEIAGDLEVPQGMGIILRTAGASRTKAEVKRDFEYLMRLWENVRSLTLRSEAPCLVYEEGSLIKRTIRDLYTKEIDELLVAGDSAYREAKDFMRMIMPSHIKNVLPYTEDQAIFAKFNVEPQLDQMFSPQVTLPSGGYIVINPTEALVSIDVNSGRSTREHNIEDTALQTNLEASEEIARQLRLRDLAGLIVIDFIDMVESRSNKAVERKLKDCLKNDRARIQVGRISHFGLMEMSRQRIRFGVVEGSTHKCPLCEGTGLIRSVESVALMVMRHVEDTVLKRTGQSISVRVPIDVALYILNAKRDTLMALEMKYNLSITLTADSKLQGSQFAIEKGEARANQFAAITGEHVKVDSAAIDDSIDEEIIEETEDEDEVEVSAVATADAPREGDDEQGRARKRRRRRGGRGDRDDRPAAATGTQPQPQRSETVEAVVAEAGDDAEGEAMDDAVAGAITEEGENERRRRRRGRRGGRRNRRGENGEMLPREDRPQAEAVVASEGGAELSSAPEAQPEAVESVAIASESTEPAVAEASVEAVADASSEAEPAAEKPKRTRRKPATAKPLAEPIAAPIEEIPVTAEAAPEAATEAAVEAKPKRPRARKPKATAEVSADAAPLDSVTEAASEPVVEAASEPVAEADAPAPEPATAPVDAEAPKRTRKALPPEGAIVASSAQPETEDAAKPKKGGWWQRGFFGG
ncbi:MAG: RNAse [Devosia sp.]|nr:RNAse [Devosia sp.]